MLARRVGREPHLDRVALDEIDEGILALNAEIGVVQQDIAANAHLAPPIAKVEEAPALAVVAIHMEQVRFLHLRIAGGLRIPSDEIDIGSSLQLRQKAFQPCIALGRDVHRMDGDGAVGQSEDEHRAAVEAAVARIPCLARRAGSEGSSISQGAWRAPRAPGG